MADVRALLRAENAARNQPKKVIKPPLPSTVQKSLKRKAVDGDSDHEDENKKLKPSVSDDVERQNEAETIPSEPSRNLPEDPLTTETATTTSVPLEPKPAPTPTTVAGDAIDDDEWAAFERDVATPPPSPPSLPAPLISQPRSTTIWAAPIPNNTDDATATGSKADADKSRKERAKDERKQREEDALAEQEEAKMKSLEEFEEMEAWEEKWRLLKEKRELLRSRAQPAAAVGNDEEEKQTLTEERPKSDEKDEKSNNSAHLVEDDDDSSSDYDELDDLGFGR